MLTIPKDFTSELNKAQKTAVENPIDSCTKIVAGAGTGKTKIISKRFVKLVFDLISAGVETPTSKILVITFTDKAAKEMKTRIIKELDKNNLNSFNDELWISTFHGFCNKILRTHCIEANLSPEFELAEEKTLNEVYEKIITTLKYDEHKTINNIDEICKTLNVSPEILNAENLKKIGNISKLDDIFENIFNVIKKIKSLGLTPLEFLTKTKQATIQYSKTIEQIPFGYDDVSDYLLNWESLLRKYIADGSRLDNSVFGEIASSKLILDKNGKRKAELWSPANSFPESVEKFTKYEDYLTEVIALLYAIFQNELERADMIDFDDLINKTVYILKNNATLRKYYQDYFKHLIIDEFQDTNGAQLELIKLLLNEDHANITFVGDRKQSIYGFRYAQMENLEVLHKYVEEKYGIKYPEIKLVTNYRSDANILYAVNYVTTKHLQLNEELGACPDKIKNTDELYVKNTKITGTQSSPETKIAEAKYIADEILKLKEAENADFRDFAILVKANAQAELLEKILSTAGIPTVQKTNAGFFSHPVIKNSIALFQLLKNPIDDHALTRILKATMSDKTLYKLTKEISQIVYDDELFDKNKRINLCEKILKLYELNKLNSKELINVYDSIMQAVKEKKDKTLLQLFVSLKNKITLFNPVTEIEKFQTEHNLKRFEKILFDYEQNNSYCSINDFLEYFEKIQDERSFELPTVLSADLDAVQILTIHASKGLEFPYVFVCGISSKIKSDKNCIKFDLQYGNKPGFGLILSKLDGNNSPKDLLYKSLWYNQREYFEYLRVFYVAVSRAKKYLNILTFEERARSKPAEYTTNFPIYVTSEQIDKEDIPNHQEEYKRPELKQEQTILPDINSDKNVQEKIHSFSFSKLNTYISCPQKFLLKYQYYFPSQTFANKATETGSIVHKLIYNSFLYERELDIQEINDILPSEISEFEKSRIHSLYTCFAHSKYSPTALKSKQIYSEKSFGFIYKVKSTEVEFVGDIDLLIENEDNTCTIIDFKTNTNLSHMASEYQKQLYLYKQALEADNLKVKSSMMVGLSEDNGVEEIKLENENAIKSEFDKELLEAINCLENPPEKIKPDGPYCHSCGYNYLCKILH